MARGSPVLSQVRVRRGKVGGCGGRLCAGEKSRNEGDAGGRDRRRMRGVKGGGGAD